MKVVDEQRDKKYKVQFDEKRKDEIRQRVGEITKVLRGRENLVEDFDEEIRFLNMSIITYFE